MLSQVEAMLVGWSDERQQTISVGLAAATMAWRFWLAASAEAAFRHPGRGAPWKTIMMTALVCRPSIWLFLPFFMRSIQVSLYDYMDTTAAELISAKSKHLNARALRDSIKQDLEIWEEAIEEVDLNEWWPERHCSIVSDCEMLKVELQQADLDVAAAERSLEGAITMRNAAIERDTEPLSWTTIILGFIWEQFVWMGLSSPPQCLWIRHAVSQLGLCIVMATFAFAHHKALLARLLCYLESL